MASKGSNSSQLSGESVINDQEKRDIFAVLMSRFDHMCEELRYIKTDISNSRAETKEITKVISENNVELKNSVTFMKETVKKFEEDFVKLKKENNYLKKELELLRVFSATNHQLIYRNSIKISNLPKVEQENLLEIVEKISNVIGFVFSPEKIDSVYRTRNRNPLMDPLIIVSFVRNIDKTEFLKLKRN
uniref:Uncharacterized protein n=1 Tax=Rhodnius prolixus TaxID=13249 RepID=T1HIW6_RHOPR